MIPINGARLHYRIDGPEGAPWIVLSNSLAADTSMWDPQMPALTASYRVLRYDNRGHGGSDDAPGPYPLDILLDDALGLISATGVERYCFVGLSLGAKLAQAAALRKAPGLIAIAVCDGQADPSPPAVAAEWEKRACAVEEHGIGTIVQSTLERWLTAPFMAGNTDVADRTRAFIERTKPGAYAAVIRGLAAAEPMMQRLREIDMPALFMTGELDPAAPPKLMCEMHSHVRGAWYVEIPGAAHLPNLQKPDAFNDALLTFLKHGVDWNRRGHA